MPHRDCGREEKCPQKDLLIRESKKQMITRESMTKKKGQFRSGPFCLLSPFTSLV